MGKYVALDVGCLECNHATYVVGVFSAYEDALSALQQRASQYPVPPEIHEGVDDTMADDTPDTLVLRDTYGGGQGCWEIHKLDD